MRYPETCVGVEYTVPRRLPSDIKDSNHRQWLRSLMPRYRPALLYTDAAEVSSDSSGIVAPDQARKSAIRQNVSFYSQCRCRQLSTPNSTRIRHTVNLLLSTRRYASPRPAVERTAHVGQGCDVTCVFSQGAEDGSFPEELWLTSARWTPSTVWTFLNWRRTRRVCVTFRYWL